MLHILQCLSVIRVPTRSISIEIIQCKKQFFSLFCLLLTSHLENHILPLLRLPVSVNTRYNEFKQELRSKALFSPYQKAHSLHLFELPSTPDLFFFGDTLKWIRKGLQRLISTDLRKVRNVLHCIVESQMLVLNNILFFYLYTCHSAWWCWCRLTVRLYTSILFAYFFQGTAVIVCWAAG